MNKCLRISFDAQLPDGFLRSNVQKYAKKMSLEGVAQVVSSTSKVLLVVSGKKANIDEFVDFLHKELAENNIQDIEVEPFVKVKDYRGVFRVIE